MSLVWNAVAEKAFLCRALLCVKETAEWAFQRNG